MPEDLAKFLGKTVPANDPDLGTGEYVGGTFACQECGSIVDQALLNYDEKLLKWVCSDKHISQVTMNV